MPARKRTRVVVDVNVLISALIKADHIFLQQLFNKQRYTVLVSDTLLEEFERVSGRARLRKHFTSEGATRALHRIRGLSEYVKANPPFTKICRDEKDDYLLALAKGSKHSSLSMSLASRSRAPMGRSRLCMGTTVILPVFLFLKIRCEPLVRTSSKPCFVSKRMISSGESDGALVIVG
jgi:putative PIN family toxin of toxin-antitoxin system